MTQQEIFAARKRDTGNALRAARKARGLTKRELAKRVGGGMQINYIRTVENGRVNPTLEVWTALYEAIVGKVSKS